MKSNRAKLFQFHKGTIKPIANIRIVERDTYFNSIKVRLNPVAPLVPSLASGNFNSIKVRLNRRSWSCGQRSARPFQFHKGTIKPNP